LTVFVADVINGQSGAYRAYQYCRSSSGVVFASAGVGAERKSKGAFGDFREKPGEMSWVLSRETGSSEERGAGRCSIWEKQNH